MLRIVSPKAWAEWEVLDRDQVRLWLWGVIFFVLNVDFAVDGGGPVPAAVSAKFWLAAMIARFPWLVASAWFGDGRCSYRTWSCCLALVGLIGAVVVFQKLRPRFRHWLVVRVAPEAPRGRPVLEREDARDDR
jgi:hypothetical protein